MSTVAFLRAKIIFYHIYLVEIASDLRVGI